ncbi:MAG: Hsp20/alpha crystallin family protein [Desulfobulbaceae bacterium]
MTKTKEKELVVKEEARPETYFGELERYFDKLFRHPFSLMTTPSFLLRDYPRLGEISPSVDIFEEEGHLVLKAELPGIKKDDLNVTITENRITISGEKKQEEKVEKKDYHWVERTYGSFTRSFRLPDNVNSDAAEATFKDGVLEVRIPKTEEAKERKIDVK